MQLILTACVQGIDGEADEPRGPWPADDPVQRLGPPPGRQEIARRARRLERRTFDAADGPGRYQQEVRSALAVREHGVARAGSIVEIHFHAGGGAMLVVPVRETLVLHDL